MALKSPVPQTNLAPKHPDAVLQRKVCPHCSQTVPVVRDTKPGTYKLGDHTNKITKDNALQHPQRCRGSGASV